MSAVSLERVDSDINGEAGDSASPGCVSPSARHIIHLVVSEHLVHATHTSTN